MTTRSSGERIMDQPSYLDQGTSLSAEVEPFIPRSDVGNMFAEHMIPQPSQGQLPHYLTSCYPFVQDQSTENAHRDEQSAYQNYYNRDLRAWPPAPPSAAQPYQHNIPPPSRFGAPQTQLPIPAVPHPTTHSTALYSYHPGPPQYQYPGLSQELYQSQYAGTATQQSTRPRTPHGKRDGGGRKSTDRKQSSNKKSGQRSVGIQMEVKKPENKNKECQEMVDNMQQTDFPSEIASKSLSEKPSPLKKATRAGRKWRRAHNAADQSASCESSDNNGDEADVDSDSGYYSPKHQIPRRNHTLPPSSGVTVRDDHQDIGTAAHPNYPLADLSPQRLVYLSGPPPHHPSTYYQVHPNSYLGAPSAPGQIIRLPSPATPPMIMTPPPPMMNLAPGAVGHRQAMAVANFKSRSTWEQEILKAHNVAPICPPAFVPRQRSPYGQNRFHRGGPQQTWRQQRPQVPRRGRNGPYQGKGIRGASPGHDGQMVDNFAPPKSGSGLLTLNPNTAPQHLIHQNPPQLTEEDFPDLRPSAAVSGSNGNASSTFSYSAAVQNKPKPAPEIDIHEDSPIKCLIEADDAGSGKGSRRRRKKTERAAKAAAEEYAEISKEQENIKKQLNKKSTSGKSKAPQLDLAEMLSKLEQTQAEDSDRNQPSKRNPQAFPKQRINQTANGQFLMPHNPLDSSAPMKKRGKEREIPKVKKPSALKKVILKEREEKKNNRLSTLATEENPEYDIPSVPTDYFKTEFTQKENSPATNHSDAVSVSEPNTPDNQSPLTVSVSGNSSPVVPANLPKIHSRRYREYCSGQVLDKQIDEECIVILQKLVQFQERMYQKDPIKAKSKRRFVLGIREVTKHLKLKKLCCVLISPNLEKIKSKGGLDDALQQILQLCKSQSIPYVFALGRCAMGRAVSKLVPVSIIGIFDYSGVEESYKMMLELVKDAQKKYHEMMIMLQQEAVEANTTPPSVPLGTSKRFPHMGHSRNPSAASGISYCSVISEPISELNPSEVPSWRNMMEVTDGQNPIPTLSPPPENVQEDDQENDASSEKKANEDSRTKSTDKGVDADQEDYEDSPYDENEDSSNMESYMNALDNSGSLTSDEQKGKAESQLDKSFSTVSTVVTRPPKESSMAEKNNVGQSSNSGIPSMIEEFNTDTTARINSWLEAATSIQGLETEDSPHPDEKLEIIEENHCDEEEDEDDFVSTHEDEVEDRHE